MFGLVAGEIEIKLGILFCLFRFRLCQMFRPKLKKIPDLKVHDTEDQINF